MTSLSEKSVDTAPTQNSDGCCGGQHQKHTDAALAPVAIADQRKKSFEGVHSHAEPQQRQNGCCCGGAHT